MMSEKDNYNYDFWFETDKFEPCGMGGEGYYVNRYYEDIVYNLDIPNEGYIVVLGTYNCYTFDKLCRKFGPERCIGLDLHNPTGHPRVRIKDCSQLSNDDDMPIAFCHNDLGSFPTTPILKFHGQKWAAKNIIPGGYMLGNNNLNRAKAKIEELMVNNGFENKGLLELVDEYDLSSLPKERLEGYMLSKKMLKI